MCFGLHPLKMPDSGAETTEGCVKDLHAQERLASSRNVIRVSEDLLAKQKSRRRKKS